jgi:hypothetical protein
MTEEEHEEYSEPKLSFVTLSSDNLTMLINGESKWVVKLPSYIARRSAAEKQRIIEKAILDGCDICHLDYVSEENITNRAKEIVNLLYERARVSKNYVAPPAHTTIIKEYRNDYFEFLIDCVRRTVKQENALVRQIIYTMLSAYSNDPINLGVLAPTSTGKTYPIIECSKFTPLGKEVRVVGSMSPKVLIREQGILIDKEGKPIGAIVRQLKYEIAKAKAKKKFDEAEDAHNELAALLDGSAYLLDLSNTALLFLEPPDPDLWAMMKPIASHDAWEIEHPFVDKVASGGLEVKRVITRGWPAFIFCSARDESKWELWAEIQSRFIIASPNMVKAKYQAGNRLIAIKKGQPHGVKQRLIISDTETELAKKSFLYLKHQIQQFTSTTESPVWIPFGRILSDILPSDKSQDNREANRFYSILNMVALCKAHLRHRLIFGDEELIIATLEDLRETLHVMQNVTGMPPHKLKFYEQYIIPLYNSTNKNKSSLTSREICDFYNVNAPKGTPKINTDLVTKIYLDELVNSSYLEREPDPDDKRRYAYQPLVDTEVILVDEGDQEQKQNNKEQDEDEDEDKQQKEKYRMISNLGQFDNFLQYLRLLVPENHPGIPPDWLNQEILQLSRYRITSAPLKILDPNGNDIPIDDFIQRYEASSSDGLKLKSFLKVPRSFDNSNSREITSSGGSEGSASEEITKNNDKSEEKLSNKSKFDIVRQFSDIINKAMLDEQGNSKGFFTLDDFVFTARMWPNLDWTINETEQEFDQLLANGRIRELEPGSGRFAPTEKLSGSKEA